MFAKIKPNTQIIGQNLVYFAKLTSTNTFAIELFKNNLAENGTVIYTDNQTMGRGQMQRQWVSNPFENLMFSIILMPVTKYVVNSFQLNKCITIALFHYISEILPLEDVKIKWPNDIMVNRKKIAGLLVENSYSGSQLNVSIVGIGLNVNQDFSSNQLYNATSLFQNKHEIFDRAIVFEKLLETIDYYYLKLMQRDNDFINIDFDQHLLGYGIENEFTVGEEPLKAKIVGCDNDGRLIIEKNNVIRHYLHGEIKQHIE